MRRRPAHGVRSTWTATFPPPPLHGPGTSPRKTPREGQPHRPPISRPWIGVALTLTLHNELARSPGREHRS